MSSDRALPYSRRLFLQQGLTLASLLPTIPAFIQQSALGMLDLDGATAVGSRPGVPEDRVLVVVQLAGGNDGLNTLIPYGAAEYYDARPGIAIAPPGRGDGAALAIPGRDGLGLHPGFAGFKALLDEGIAAVVPGVGYPNPNRSHFASTDIWETASLSGKGHGWVGRYFDCTCAGTPDPHGSVAIGRQAPLALMGASSTPVSFESAELFRWLGHDLDSALSDPYEALMRRGTATAVPTPQRPERRRPSGDPSPESESQLAFLTRTALDARVSSDRIRAAVERTPLTNYPQGALARQLRIVAAMIRDGLSTRVYYVSLGGFDTHAGQVGAHANLLRQLGDSLRAFQRDLAAQGNDGRVLTMVFSEFGRRVRQNASQGTDHGTAAPMFLVGPMVRPGVQGRHPSLVDLDQGDLRHTIDFRSVYAAILGGWMKAPAARVLGGTFAPAEVLRT
ncbi:MAG TPA: DUF1501 domain-containing protein [Phycisphaerales bacterium]|nr:DUF1501 domain-containing protein [Phycisphaerales bacterium]HMP37293.1 DUF1501 domain-containing protein [Phycisphaerales bacterium]